MIFKKLASFFDDLSYRDTIETLNTLLSRLDFKNNFDGQYIDTTIDARTDYNNWEPNLAFTAGEIIIAPDGNLYECLTNHTSWFLLDGDYTNFLRDFDQGIWQSVNYDTIIKHSLGKIPSGFLIYDRKSGGLILRGDTAWTANSISLKNQSPLSANVKLFIFR